MKIWVKKSIAWQEYFGKIYIFDDVNHNSFTLEDTAMVIWKSIIKTKNYEKTLEEMFNHFPAVDKNSLANDIKTFVMDLKHNRIVRIVYDNKHR